MYKKLISFFGEKIRASYKKYIDRWEKKKRKKLGDRGFLEKYSFNDKFYIKQGKYMYPLFAVSFLMIGIIRYKLYIENGESIHQFVAVSSSICGLFWTLYAIFGYKEKNRWAYFIIVDEKLAGFVMVIDLPEVNDRSTDFQMAEFFILHKYRRMNVGKKAVFEIFSKHQGDWQLKVHPENKTSIHFWTNVIDEYTNGKYEMIESYPNTEYDDNTLGNIYFFNTKK
jgi:predicted acetyltransferase